MGERKGVSLWINPFSSWIPFLSLRDVPREVYLLYSSKGGENRLLTSGFFSDLRLRRQGPFVYSLPHSPPPSSLSPNGRNDLEAGNN